MKPLNLSSKTKGNLTDSEEKYRSLFNNLPLGISYFDKSRRIIELNDVYSSIMGAESEQLQNVDLRKLPDKKMAACYERTLKGEKCNFKGPYTTFLTGKKLHINADFSPVRNDKSEVIGGVCIIEDLSDKVKKEKELQEKDSRYQLMVEGSERVFFYVHDRENKFTYVSPSVKKVLGYEADDLIGKSFEGTLWGTDKNNAAQITAEMYKTGKRKEPYTLKAKHKDSYKLILEILETPVISNGEVISIHGFARNVTQRVMAQDELRKNKELLDSINRNIHEGIFRLSEDEGILYANHSFVRMFNYGSFEELAELKSDAFYIRADDRNSLFKTIRQDGNFNNQEIALKRKDGSLFWGLVSGNGVFDDDGNLLYYDGAITDITARKGDLENLRKSEEQHRNLFHNSMVGIYRCRISDARPLNINQKALRLFGYENMEEFEFIELLLNKHDWVIVKDLLLKKGQFDDYEFRMKRKDGEIICVTGSAKYYPDKEYFEGFFIDITDRKQSDLLQKALYHIAEKTNDIQDLDRYFRNIHRIVSRLMNAGNFYIAIHDRDTGKITFPYFIDENKNQITGKKPARGLTEYVLRTGKPLLADQKKIKELINDGHVEGLDPMCEVWLGVPLKTSYNSLGVLVVQSYDNPGDYSEREKKILTFVSQHVATAIEKKRYEENIIKAKEQAEQANKTKSIFLANMSHELRSPLNSIVGFTRRLLKGSGPLTDTRNQNALKTISRNAGNLFSLINDILDLSKVEAGKMDFDQKDVKLADLCTQIIEEVEPMASAKNISVTFKCSQDYQVKADPRRLRQVLLNIINNAIKFTDDGSVDIRLAANGENEVLIMVKDTGLGISEDRMDVIFNMYEQVDSDRDEKRGGSGLGLTISRRLAREMGGDVTVASKPNQGSCFTIHLPLNNHTATK
ncbi:MAG: PAS domain S-box protein [Balneolales bacterium]